MKIGVYVCHCGTNIAKAVDVTDVVAFAANQPDVALAKEFKNMCSGQGQKMIRDDIKEHKLDRVVVAACSPNFHLKTFKKVVTLEGLSPYYAEMVNFREQVSWPHGQQTIETNTQKAKVLLNISLARIRQAKALKKKKMKIGKTVTVIGGGVAGIQAALDLGDLGCEVHVIEKEPTIGGKMALLTKTFPTEDCAACILAPKMSDVASHKNVTVHTNSEIKGISGHRLHFDVMMDENPRFIKTDADTDACLGCDKCKDVCPVEVPNQFEMGLTKRKAIYIPSSLAIPYKYIIDKENCLYFKDGSCRKCEEVCPEKYIKFDQKPEEKKITTDTIVVATGYDLFDCREKTVYGYGKFENVVNGLEMEIIVDKMAKEPLKGIDKKKRIAFIQCVGSRDEKVNREYCSRVCCMYATKLAQLTKHADPTKEIYVFYTDLRAFGKGYEEYYKRAMNSGIRYIRGRVGEAFEDPITKKVTLKVEDTLSRKMIESEFDLVVLSAGMDLSKGGKKIAELLKLAKSPDGFLQEAHPKFKPVDTNVEGVFIAGCSQGPKDIPDTVAQAGAAASRAAAAMFAGEYEIEPTVAYVHKDMCNGTKACLTVCPADAITFNDKTGKAEVNAALCLGCGSCLAVCPTNALDLAGATNTMMVDQVKAALAEKGKDEKRIIVFADTTASYRLADTVGMKKKDYPTNTFIIPVPSGSRITSRLIVEAFKLGADGVYVADCEKETSPYAHSLDVVADSVKKAQGVLKKAGIDDKRVAFSAFSTTMIEPFVTEMNKIATVIDKSAIGDDARGKIGDPLKGGGK